MFGWNTQSVFGLSARFGVADCCFRGQACHKLVLLLDQSGRSTQIISWAGHCVLAVFGGHSECHLSKPGSSESKVMDSFKQRFTAQLFMRQPVHLDNLTKPTCGKHRSQHVVAACQRNARQPQGSAATVKGLGLATLQLSAGYCR